MSAIQSSGEAFSMFGLEPSPWVDAEAHKNRFLELSAATHPDRFQGPAKAEAEQKSQALNRAYQLLKEPKTRLAYLYELAAGHPSKDIQRIPPGTMDLFVEVGQTCQAIDIYLKEKQKAQGALAKAQFAAQGIEQQEKLGQLQAKLEAFSSGLTDSLQELQQAWQKGERDLAALETLYRKFSYLTRWKQQIDERGVALLVDS